jgi:hypothetical protein
MESTLVTIQGTLEHVSIKALFTGKFLHFSSVYLMFHTFICFSLSQIDRTYVIGRVN